MDRGAWWATVHGSQRVRHDWATTTHTWTIARSRIETLIPDSSSSPLSSETGRDLGSLAAVLIPGQMLPQPTKNHLSHPSALTPEHTPTLTSKKEPTHPASEIGAKELVCFHSLCCSKSPSKAWLEVLVPPLINFYWLRRPRTLVHM